jgi:CHAT domain-containing protein
MGNLTVDIQKFPLGSRANNQEIAIACYQAALEVYTREAFPEDWAMTQNNLGNAYSDRIKGERGENLEGAIACYQAALEVRTREAFPQNHANTLYGLGLAYRDAAQLENARSSFAGAIDTVEEIRSGIVLGGEADRQKLAAEWNKLYVNMVEVCLELEDSAAALEYAERGKARNLVELFAASRLKPEGVSEEVWEEYRSLHQQWQNLQQQGDGSSSPTNDGSANGDSRSIGVSSTAPATATADVSQLLAGLRQQIDGLIETKITPHDPKFRFGQQVEPIRYSEIQALAKEGTAIVEWYFTRDGIQAFVVTGRGQQPIVVSTGGDALAALVDLTEEYLTDYYNNGTHWRQELPSRLQRLAEILELDKLISEIPSGCRELVLVPYRFLHLFPLHGLPVSQTSQKPGFSTSQKPGFSKKPGFLESGLPLGKGDKRGILGDLFPQGIRYVPSSQILQISLSEDSPTEDSSLFAIQNPTGDLAYTDIEVEAIQTAFNPATVLKGEAATKTAFQQAVATLKETGYAHFSCHGYFNFANPRISGLILADAQLPPTDSTDSTDKPRIRSRRGEFDAEKCLTLPEIFNLRLRRCRLVALSACETGITDISTTSDEYFSILAGFFFAGSRSVLGTLWAVDDVSTAIFMIRFYETLLGETQPPVALALKETQEWMRGVTVAKLLKWVEGCKLVEEERREEIREELDGWYSRDEIPFSSPYFWAGFCAVGQ